MPGLAASPSVAMNATHVALGEVRSSKPTPSVTSSAQSKPAGLPAPKPASRGASPAKVVASKGLPQAHAKRRLSGQDAGMISGWLDGEASAPAQADEWDTKVRLMWEPDTQVSANMSNNYVVQGSLNELKVTYVQIDVGNNPFVLKRAIEQATAQSKLWGLPAPPTNTQPPAIFVGDRFLGCAADVRRLKEKGELSVALAELGYLHKESADGKKGGEFDEDKVSLFTTTITADRQVRDRCRDFEHFLYLHRVAYDKVDVAQSPYLKKRLQAEEERARKNDPPAEKQKYATANVAGEIGLPALYFGTKLVIRAGELHDVVDDEKFIPKLQQAGYVHVPVALPKPPKVGDSDSD